VEEHLPSIPSTRGKGKEKKRVGGRKRNEQYTSKENTVSSAKVI
jgi:hypothetical protein